MSNEQLRLDHLKQLLAGRQEEYKVFGRTEEDAKQDEKIIKEIEELEAKLKKIKCKKE